jgi:hypothetical protein
MWRTVVTIESMSAATRRTQEAASQYLQQRITRSADHVAYVLEAPGDAPFRTEEVIMGASARAVLRRVPEEDLVALASFIACHEINKSLQGWVDISLLPFQGRELRQVPRTLLASAYLQLAVEVGGGTRWKTCSWCGERFPGRRNQKYDSRSCKNAAAYERGKT